MKNDLGRKLLKVFLVLTMLFSSFTASAQAEENSLRGESSTWEKASSLAAAAASGKLVAVTMTDSSGKIYALPTAKSPSAGPSAVSATRNEDGSLEIAGIDTAFGWKVASTGSGYTFINGSGDYLYLTANNNGVRVNTKPDVGYLWNITSDYLTAVDSANVTRYLGVYNATNWRCYTSINNNIKDQTLEFWTIKSSSGPAPVIAQLDKFTAAPEKDSQLVIYNPENEAALTTTASGSKLAGVSASVENGKLNQTEAMAYLTVVINGNGYYQFKDENGNFLTAGATGNSLTFEATAGNYSLWALQQQSDGTWYILSVNAEYNGIQQALEYYSGFTTFGVQENDSRYKFELYGVHGSGSVVPETYTVTVNPAEHGEVKVSKTEVEAGGQVVVTVIPEDKYELDKLLVNNVETAVQNNTVTLTVNSNLVISATFKQIKEATGTAGYVQITDLEDLQDGDQVVIVNLANNMALSQVYAGYYNSGEAVTIEDNKVTNATETMVWTVGVSNGVYTFSTADGKKLSMAATRTSMPLGEVNDTWTISPAPTIADAFFISNVGRQGYTVEWYAQNNNWSAYNNTSNEALFAQGIFKAAPKKEGLITDLSTLEDGDTIAIVNDANGVALSQVYAGYYNSGEAVTIEDNKVTNATETMVWTVGVSNGVYTFSTADGKKLSMAATRTSMPLGEVNDTWTISPAPTIADAFFISNVGRQGYTVEWYAQNNNWSAYNNTSNEALFAQKLYHVALEENVPPVTGDTYGLARTISTGDKVILYNAKNGTGVGNSLSGTRVNGVALTPVDGVITTDKTDVVWTVTVNADGTYTFTQDDKTLGGVADANRNNLVVTNAQATKWTLTGPDGSDFNYFMNLGELTSSYGSVYLEYYNGFTLYGSNNPDKDAFGITFYKQGAEPETPQEVEGDLITDLSQLKDGATVAIYSPGHKTAISTKPNGDWYLKANAATIQDGKVKNFTQDFIWKVAVNADGTYSFYAYDDVTHTICVWPSGSYAEVTVLFANHPDADNKWNLAKAKTANSFYVSSKSITGTNNRGVTGPAYLEAFVRNEAEVFSGFFNTVDKLTENDFALQFYLIDPKDAIEAFDDGEWDGIMEKGSQYVVYNALAGSSLGLFKEANYALDAIPTTIDGTVAIPGNGAYAFTVDTMGRYYSFEVDGKYLATNEAEELLFVEKDENGKLPEAAKWYLSPKNGSYIIYNKDVTYNGTPVCIEYYSSVFSGWTFSTKNDVNIYLFDFYKVRDDVVVYKNVVQDPSVIFDCADSRHLEEDYKVSLSLDDLADEISAISIRYVVNGRRVDVTDYETNADGKAYSFLLKAEDIDGNEKPTEFKLIVDVINSYGIAYRGEKTITILDEPFFYDMNPAPNKQTGDDMRPTISAKAGNVGANPTFRMLIDDVEVEAVFQNGVLSYTPQEDMPNGRTTVKVSVTRADGVSGEKVWSFTVGKSEYQLYFGQLHSHTTYSDGSGSLETALEYIATLPESANVDFVAFTDHSNYFDTTSAANPADAMNNASLMTPASAALWAEYKNAVANFNAKHDDIVAIAGYEMTWSGGPGHINSYNTQGIVSRNNASLNNKTGDAGMKLYYETMNKDNGETMHQFNHPGSTFGNFTDFSYWDEETDAHMFLVEVGNGEGQVGEGGYFPSYEQYILALDNGWHLAPTNNQDNHKGRWGNANDARDVVLTNDFSEEGIYDAIRNLRVYATEDKNLELTYTVNGQQMGTIFDETNAPKTLNVEVTVYDPDDEGIAKVELVCDGGAVAYTWEDQEAFVEGYLTAEVAAKKNYYFVRVTQKDGDLIVSAPVWVGSVADLGIRTITSSPETLYKGENTTLTTTFYNNEEQDATVKSIVYMINGSQIIGTDNTSRTLKAGETLNVTFDHVFTLAKHTTVTIKAVIAYDEDERTYSKDIELSIFDRDAGISSISTVQNSSTMDDKGYEFIIEGVATSNASDFDKDTAFFDCIYIQDETGGICCFPVSGNYKIGDKVRVTGYTDYYQGELELQVEDIIVIGEGEVAPTEITAAQLNNRSVEGKLVTIKGTVVSYEAANGLIQTIMVKDANGKVARVFIDGYITTAYDVERLFEGNSVTATGLASYDDTWPDTSAFPRIRIRDRKDIVCDNYKIIEGDNETWTKGSEDDLLIVSNAPNDRFDGLYVDGELVDSSLYARVSGSTRITLPASYLETLTEGSHTIEIRSDDGSASTSVTIMKANDPDPVNPDPDPVNPDPVIPDVPIYSHPMTGIDSEGHFRAHEWNIRKY